MVGDAAERDDRRRRVGQRLGVVAHGARFAEQVPLCEIDAIVEKLNHGALFLDTFGEARLGGHGTLDLTVRAAASLAERYLRAKDRLGFVSFGGTVSWLLPGTGLAQLYRIADAMLESEIALSYAWKGLDLIPRRTLPPQAPDELC